MNNDKRLGDKGNKYFELSKGQICPLLKVELLYLFEVGKGKITKNAALK